MPVDRTALAAVLDDFALTVTGDFTVDDVLRALAEGATRVLGLAGAGVAAPDKTSDDLRHVHATSVDVEKLERLQELMNAGPCRDAVNSGSPVNLHDVATQGTWPVYQRLAAEVGIAAVAAIPLMSRHRGPWGVLDLYRREARALDEEELAAAQTLANLATSYLVITHERDVAQSAQESLRHRAVHDELTGLPVRWFFLEQLALSLRRLPRSPHMVGVLFLDLDGLKYVNDTYGHAAGDEFINVCVERIQAALRPADVLARMGGDEFAILLSEIAHLDDAVAVGARIRDSLQRPFHAEGGRLRPSASVGVVVTDDTTATGAALVAHADAAMYQAKRTGKGQVSTFDEGAYARERTRRSAEELLVEELEETLSGQGIEVHYQPIYRLTPEPQVAAVEALLRWRHPQQGLLTAGAFIDVAERHGLLPDLGTRLRHLVCEQLAAWDVELGARAPQRLFVNVAPTELAEPGYALAWQRALAEHGLRPQRITFEITEGGLFTNDASLFALEELRELGCALAIDDFGTGYSSLSRLSEVPVRWIKVDQWFAFHLASRASAEAVISATCTMAQRLGNDVIVEGVEDERTLRQLRALGVDHVQGYHLARPMPAVEIGRLLEPPDL